MKNEMFADFHIHSRFSRACSKDISFPNLVKWARIKGLNLLGTGDFTHPVWIEEIKNLKGNGKGFYYYDGFPFIISGEISLVYTHNEKGRRVHLNMLVPSIEIAERINSYIDNRGLRRDYDGRPIFKISCEEFVSDMLKISHAIEIIPAHIWTPWFGVLGSRSGYDSLSEAFGEQAKNIHAIETGISSDPAMNLKIKELENRAIISFSDAHSFWPWRLGREATIFRECESFFEIIEQIRKNNFIGTVETNPAYGKYHLDGHRDCKFSCSHEKTKELRGKCPKCGGNLVVGVDSRVDELASREGAKGKPFYSILPLHEIISLYYGIGINSKKAWDVYWVLIKKFENEFNILLGVEKEELRRVVEGSLVDLILKNRGGEIKVKSGYDGEYGVALLNEGKNYQATLF